MFRDTTITTVSKRKELLIFLSCFIGANILNMIGIIHHSSQAKELVTQLHVVLIVSMVLYGMVLILRALYYLVSRIWIR